MAQPARMFGIKDLFTSVNALGGALSILFCVYGKPVWAGAAILVGYLGDALDGWVARKLGTSNKFGSEFDTIADHLSHCIGPATVFYTTQRHVDYGLGQANEWLAMGLGATIMLFGSIRHARNAVRPIDFKGIWCGMPRPVFGFLVIGYANSLLWPEIPGGAWAGVAIVVAGSALSLSYLPFTSHHLARRLRLAARIGIACFFVSTFLVLALWPRWAFDVLFFWMFGYCFSGVLALTPEERQIWREKVAEAKLKPA